MTSNSSHMTRTVVCHDLAKDGCDKRQHGARIVMSVTRETVNVQTSITF